MTNQQMGGPGYRQGQNEPGQYQGSPYQQPMQPPTIIVNNTASASAAAGARSGYGFRRRQSLMVHTVLFFTTAGLGNIVNGWYIWDWNRRHGM